MFLKWSKMVMHITWNSCKVLHTWLHGADPFLTSYLFGNFRNFQSSRERKRSSSTQKPITGPHSEPDLSSQHPSYYSFNTHFNIILLPFYFMASNQNCVHISFISHTHLILHLMTIIFSKWHELWSSNFLQLSAVTCLLHQNIPFNILF